MVEISNHHITEIAVSAVLFIFLWQVLGKLVFKPFVENFDERQARTAGSEHLAVEKRQQAKQLSAAVEEELRTARLKGIRLRDEKMSRAKEEAQKIIDRASAQAMEELTRAERQIQELKLKAQDEVPQEVAKLSELVVSRALATDTARTVH